MHQIHSTYKNGLIATIRYLLKSRPASNQNNHLSTNCTAITPSSDLTFETGHIDAPYQLLLRNDKEYDQWSRHNNS